MSIWNRKGQSTAEYAIVLGVVIAALVGMQLYVKRGLNAKMKDVSDHLASEAGMTTGTTADHLRQYEPYYTGTGAYQTDVAKQKATETMTAGGKIARTGIDEESTRKTTTSVVQGSDLATDDQWQ